MRSPAMNSICNDGCDGVFAFFKDQKKVFLCFSIVHAHCKLIVEFGNALGMHIFKTAVQHQVYQIIHNFTVFSQIKECL
jgi:hypothetical protein